MTDSNEDSRVILRSCLARGEIGLEEYREIKSLLIQSDSPLASATETEQPIVSKQKTQEDLETAPQKGEKSVKGNNKGNTAINPWVAICIVLLFIIRWCRGSLS